MLELSYDELWVIDDEKMREVFYREGYTISTFEGFVRLVRKYLRLSRKCDNCEDTAIKTEISKQMEDTVSDITFLYRHYEDMFDIFKRYPCASPEVLAKKAMRESEYAFFYRIPR